MDQHRAMLSLIIQPLEVLHQILCYVNVQDLANLNLTCRMLHDFIARDDLLWRRQYMNIFVRQTLWYLVDFDGVS